MAGSSRSNGGHWLRRIAWLIGIWAASVAVLGLVAYGIRIVMNAAGMTAG